MSWIDDEAQRSQRKEEAERQHAHTLRYSNFWATLLQRLQADISYINEYQ